MKHLCNVHHVIDGTFGVCQAHSTYDWSYDKDNTHFYNITLPLKCIPYTAAFTLSIYHIYTIFNEQNMFKIDELQVIPQFSCYLLRFFVLKGTIID